MTLLLDKIKHGFENLLKDTSAITLWVPILVVVCVYLFVVRRKDGYAIARGGELKTRAHKLLNFLAIVYFAMYLVWGMFVLPINYLASSAEWFHSLFYILVAIIITYIAHKIIFSNKFAIYAFAIFNSFFLAIYIASHQAPFKGLT